MTKKKAKKAAKKVAKKSAARKPAAKKRSRRQNAAKKAAPTTPPPQAAEAAAKAEAPAVEPEFRESDVPIEDVGFGAALDDLEIERVTAEAPATAEPAAAVAVEEHPPEEGASPDNESPQESSHEGAQTATLMSALFGAGEDAGGGSGGDAVSDRGSSAITVEAEVEHRVDASPAPAAVARDPAPTGEAPARSIEPVATGGAWLAPFIAGLVIGVVIGLLF